MEFINEATLVSLIVMIAICLMSSFLLGYFIISFLFFTSIKLIETYLDSIKY